MNNNKKPKISSVNDGLAALARDTGGYWVEYVNENRNDCNFEPNNGVWIANTITAFERVHTCMQSAHLHVYRFKWMPNMHCGLWTDWESRKNIVGYILWAPILTLIMMIGLTHHTLFHWTELNHSSLIKSTIRCSQDEGVGRVHLLSISKRNMYPLLRQSAFVLLSIAWNLIFSRTISWSPAQVWSRKRSRHYLFKVREGQSDNNKYAPCSPMFTGLDKVNTKYREKKTVAKQFQQSKCVDNNNSVLSWIYFPLQNWHNTVRFKN